MLGTDALLTAPQYRALQDPVVPPSPIELFEFVVEKLVSHNLATYEIADTFRGTLPSGLFLLVPRRPPQLTYDEVVSMIEWKGVRGRSFLDPSGLTDTIETPGRPYLLTAIDDGYAMRAGHAAVARQEILQHGRSPYTLWEGIVHAIVFPSVFQSHSLNLCGTTVDFDRSLVLEVVKGRPELHAYWCNRENSRWGVPSCRARI